MRKAIRTAAFACLALAGAAAAQSAQAQVYWRMEVGWSQPNEADFKDNDWNNAGNICRDPLCSGPGTVNNINGSLILGAGVGYRSTSGLRGDVTFAYRPSYALHEFVGDATYSANIQSTTLMVNGYYDFTAGGVRPYLGAGIGWARNDTDKLTQNFGLGFSNTFNGATKDNAAFALMAGVGVPLPGWTLDIGYRYIDMGKFGTGPGAAFGISSGHTGKLTAHELTLGARF